MHISAARDWSRSRASSAHGSVHRLSSLGSNGRDENGPFGAHSRASSGPIRHKPYTVPKGQQSKALPANRPRLRTRTLSSNSFNSRNPLLRSSSGGTPSINHLARRGPSTNDTIKDFRAGGGDRAESMDTGFDEEDEDDDVFWKEARDEDEDEDIVFPWEEPPSEAESVSSEAEQTEREELTEETDELVVKLMEKLGCSKGTARRILSVGWKFYEWVEFDGGYYMKPLNDLPPSVIVSYINQRYRGIISGKTASRHISYLRRYFYFRGWNFPEDISIKYALMNVTRDTPASSFQPQRPPVLRPHLLELDLNLTNSGEDRAIDAAAKSSTFGQIRLGEILPDSSDPNDYDATVLPVVRDLSSAGEDRASQSLFLPKTKTDQFKGARAFIPGQLNDPICPVTSNITHIKANRLRESSPLFAYRDEDGNLKCLTRARFLERVNEIWSQYGRQRITGHSFRIGGTTMYLAAGVEPEVVKVLGRWKSDAFRAYWRDVESIAPHHVVNLMSRRPAHRRA